MGVASALALAEAGADVVLAARSADQLDAVARAVEAAGRRAHVVPADLRDLDAVADLADRAFQKFGRLDVVASDEATMSELTSKTPLGRVGEPEDVAAAVLNLSSPAGVFITGKVIEIDGGLQQPNLDLRLPDRLAGAEQ